MVRSQNIMNMVTHKKYQSACSWKYLGLSSAALTPCLNDEHFCWAHNGCVSFRSIDVLTPSQTIHPYLTNMSTIKGLWTSKMIDRSSITLNHSRVWFDYQYSVVTYLTEFTLAAWFGIGRYSSCQEAKPTRHFVTSRNFFIYSKSQTYSF